MNQALESLAHSLTRWISEWFCMFGTTLVKPHTPRKRCRAGKTELIQATISSTPPPLSRQLLISAGAVGSVEASWGGGFSSLEITTAPAEEAWQHKQIKTIPNFQKPENNDHFALWNLQILQYQLHMLQNIVFKFQTKLFKSLPPGLPWPAICLHGSVWSPPDPYLIPNTDSWFLTQLNRASNINYSLQEKRRKGKSQKDKESKCILCAQTPNANYNKLLLQVRRVITVGGPW